MKGSLRQGPSPLRLRPQVGVAKASVITNARAQEKSLICGTRSRRQLYSTEFVGHPVRQRQLLAGLVRQTAWQEPKAGHKGNTHLVVRSCTIIVLYRTLRGLPLLRTACLVLTVS